VFIFFLKYSPEPAGQFSIKFGTNLRWLKRIQNCVSKGPDPLQRGDNYKNAKIWWSFKNISTRESSSQNRSYLHESFVT
jgi:hypothetical protein